VHKMSKTTKSSKTENVRESFKKFAEYGSEEYHKFNGNEKSVLPLIVRYEGCTVVGTWHLRQIGDEKIRDTVRGGVEKAVLDYIKATPKEKRFVMVEGINGGNVITEDGRINIPFKSLDSAMKNGEPMGVLYLAKEHGIRAISPEPTDKESIRHLQIKGFTKEEAMLFFISRQLPYVEQGKMNEFLPWFVSRLAQESKYLKKEPTNEEVMTIIKKQNALFEKLYGKPMIITENGTMRSNLTPSEVNRLISPALVVDRPKEAKLLNHINFELDIIRNKKIIEEMAKATDSGLSPFVIYGRSHIAIMKPVLDYLYGEPLEVRL
jgi:hypothetical protein